MSIHPRNPGNFNSSMFFDASIGDTGATGVMWVQEADPELDNQVAWTQHAAQNVPTAMQIAENAILQVMMTGGGPQDMADVMNTAFKANKLEATAGVEPNGDVTWHDSVGESARIQLMSDNSSYELSFSVGGGKNALNMNERFTHYLHHQLTPLVWRERNFGGHYAVTGQFIGNEIKMTPTLGTKDWITLMKEILERARCARCFDPGGGIP